VFYTFSVLLNKIYNQKSERKFFKLINKIKNNVNFIKCELLSYNSEIESYRREYEKDSLGAINKCLKISEGGYSEGEINEKADRHNNLSSSTYELIYD
jgi:hypothetical protein